MESSEHEYTGTVAPSNYDVDHMSDIMAGHGDWFSADLLRLIGKADLQNRERIRKGFPNHVAAYEKWHG